MSDALTLIHHHAHAEPDMKRVPLRADRGTLAKRRWRGKADDGREFGFDLDAPLRHDECFFLDGAAYVIEQQPEPVFEIAVSTPEEAATIAWQIGNLHLGVQVLPTLLRVVDDPAAAQMLEREGLTFSRRTEIFQPIAANPGHHHHAHA